MKFIWKIAPGLSVLLALGSCSEPAATAKRLATLPAMPPLAAPLPLGAAPAAAPPAAPAAARAFGGYHRYRGTVGGLPVTVELNMTGSRNATSCQGSYYYERRGGSLWLRTPVPQPATAGLLLAETTTAATADTEVAGQPPATAHWQAQQPAGSVLAGTWTSAAGRRLPFQLREEYAGAVRYEILTETLAGGTCQTGSSSGQQQHQLQAAQQYLHLLGPDTLRPGLRALQCPKPAQRRAELRAKLQELGCEADNEHYGSYNGIDVTYNGNGLLSLLQTYSDDLGGAYPSNDNAPVTYDLATGKPCNVRAWLRPDKAQALTKLFDHYLRADSIGVTFATDPVSGPGAKHTLADLPEFGLNSAGLSYTLGSIGAPHVVQGVAITVPYAALGPCVRLGSLLAQLLQARGLVPKP